MTSKKFPPNINTIVNAVLSEWPEHARFIDRGVNELDTATMSSLESIAEAIVSLTSENLASYAADYRIMCRNINDEEYYFRRNGSYRFATYDEVADFVYHNEDYMTTYMRGLLVSQVLWTNHVGVMHYYRSRFLNKHCIETSRHLEVGPGHGLFMHLALLSKKFAHCEGWDLSASSIKEAEHNLRALNHRVEAYSLHHRDALGVADNPESIDALTISEVLEHTENPQEVLNSLFEGLRPGGKIFVNIPLNCPAIDHIYLYRTKEDIVSQVEKSGFRLLEVEEFPVTGFTLERARKMDATISVALVAERTI